MADMTAPTTANGLSHQFAPAPTVAYAPPPRAFGEPAPQAVTADPVPPVTTQNVQAAVEGVPVPDDDTVELDGARFRLAESIGLMPLLKFAHAAKQGLNSDDMDGLNAMYLLLRSCIAHTPVQAVNEDGFPMVDGAGEPVWLPTEWDRFEQHALDCDADGEQLTAVIQESIQVISARPPKRRGDSSPSSSPTSESTKASSSSPGTRPGFEHMTDVATLGR